MNNIPIDWLLKSDPWTEYRTRLDLIGEAADSPGVTSARARMLAHPMIKSMMESLKGWPGPVVNSHKSAGLMFHQLPFLADLGITAGDDPMPLITDKILKLDSDEGPFGVTMNIPVHFGGTGIDSIAWALCDSPRTTYALIRLGLQNHEKVIRARDYLLSLSRGNGFPCTVSKELGKFRGPGKKDDPCPYATLIMLNLMSLSDYLRNSGPARDSVKSLLDIWENSTTRHPYMFFMGTDFRKLKAPLVWFDILHVADTLSNFSFALSDPRFLQMVDIITSKAGPDGKFIPESVWKAWSDWEFGQKKNASPYLTFLAWRIIIKAKRSQPNS